MVCTYLQQLQQILLHTTRFFSFKKIVLCKTALFKYSIQWIKVQNRVVPSFLLHAVQCSRIWKFFKCRVMQIRIAHGLVVCILLPQKFSFVLKFHCAVQYFGSQFFLMFLELCSQIIRRITKYIYNSCLAWTQHHHQHQIEGAAGPPRVPEVIVAHVKSVLSCKGF